VMLTFDDAYVDFAEVAWPLLEAYGFPATIFVVADSVGGAATWDTHHGEAAPLLSWDQLRALEAAGVELGSHSGSHVPITSLSPHEALQRELVTRATFERELGRPVSALAYPYGDVDDAMRHTMARAGYTIAVTTRDGLSTVWDDPLKLPRQEVSGDDDLDDFVAKLGSARPHNPLRRALHRHRRATERARQLF
ncbi:MAG: polysaccharide deacetylase family protein, partial [Ilumatobacteraceae bacterium]